MNGTLDRDTPRSDLKARAVADKLFREGAILSEAGEHGRDLLLGDICWSEDGGVYFFIAYGEGPRDAGHLRFDRVTLDAATTVSFSRDGRMLATVRRIEDASVDDADDYRIAWQLWQQVVPLRRAVIEHSYLALADTNCEDAKRPTITSR